LPLKTLFLAKIREGAGSEQVRDRLLKAPFQALLPFKLQFSWYHRTGAYNLKVTRVKKFPLGCREITYPKPQILPDKWFPLNWNALPDDPWFE